MWGEGPTHRNTCCSSIITACCSRATMGRRSALRATYQRTKIAAQLPYTPNHNAEEPILGNTRSRSTHLPAECAHQGLEPTNLCVRACMHRRKQANACVASVRQCRVLYRADRNRDNRADTLFGSMRSRRASASSPDSCDSQSGIPGAATATCAWFFKSFSPPFLRNNGTCGKDTLFKYCHRESSWDRIPVYRIV